MNMKEEIDKLVVRCYEDKGCSSEGCAGCPLGVECGEMQARQTLDFIGFNGEAMTIRVLQDRGLQKNHDHLQVCKDGKPLCYMHIDLDSIDIYSESKHVLGTGRIKLGSYED